MKDTKYVIIHGVDGMEEGYSETEAVLFTSQDDAIQHYEALGDSFKEQGYKVEDTCDSTVLYTHDERTNQILELMPLRADLKGWMVWDQMESSLNPYVFTDIALIRSVMGKQSGNHYHEELDEFLAELQHEDQAMWDVDDVCIHVFKIK